MPTKLADSIKANVYTVICMSQSGGPNVTVMSQALGLAPKQTQACRELKADKKERVFEAIVKLNGKWQTPFLIRVKDKNIIKDLSNSELQTVMMPLLEKLNKQVIPRTEYSLLLKQKQEKVSEERQEKTKEKEAVEGTILIKILTNIRDYPFIDQKTRIQKLDLPKSSATTDKLFKELVARGYVTTCRVGLGKGHSTKTFYEITDKGKQFAKMDKADIPGKGDFKHKFWQHTIKEYFESLGYHPEIEKRYGFKNVDIGLDMNGLKTAIEVELSPDHLIENIQKDLEAGCEQIIIAVSSKRAISTYKKKIEFYNKDFLDRIEFRVLTDFLS